MHLQEASPIDPGSVNKIPDTFLNPFILQVYLPLNRLISTSHSYFNFYLRISSNKEAISKWNEIAKMVADENNIGTKPVHRFLKETGCPECYLDNAEYLEKFEPHGLYPTSIYRKCDGDILAKPDASVVECTMRHILTTTAKIVYKVLDPANPELKNVYKPLGRFVWCDNLSFHALFIWKYSVLLLINDRQFKIHFNACIFLHKYVYLLHDL